MQPSINEHFQKIIENVNKEEPIYNLALGLLQMQLNIHDKHVQILDKIVELNLKLAKKD